MLKLVVHKITSRLSKVNAYGCNATKYLLHACVALRERIRSSYRKREREIDRQTETEKTRGVGSCRFTGRLARQYRSMCRCWRLLVACVWKQDGASRVVEHEEENFKCQSVKELVGFRGFYFLGCLSVCLH